LSLRTVSATTTFPSPSRSHDVVTEGSRRLHGCFA
jgi:hypothetical protein